MTVFLKFVFFSFVIALLTCEISSSNDGMVDGVYKVGTKKYSYSYKRSGKQTAFIWTPDFPNKKETVFNAVRYSIDVAYGKNTLISPYFETVYIQGVGLMKFMAKGRFILVTLTKDSSNGRVFGWTMFESDK